MMGTPAVMLSIIEPTPQCDWLSARSASATHEKHARCGMSEDSHLRCPIDNQTSPAGPDLVDHRLVDLAFLRGRGEDEWDRRFDGQERFEQMGDELGA